MSELSIFEVLSAVNVNNNVEEKNGLSYLSWAWAWAEVVKRYPEASYRIPRFENNLPYVYDPVTGYMVFTEVTIDGVTREMWLPVMNGANKAMKAEPYTYTVMVWNKVTKKKEPEEKVVEAATMFDINKTIMRCFAKNLAMFGLGLYIFAGEDLPVSDVLEMGVLIDMYSNMRKKDKFVDDNISTMEKRINKPLNTWTLEKLIGLKGYLDKLKKEAEEEPKD